MQKALVSSIDTVIFDFGGVFTTSPLVHVRRHAGKVGVDPAGLAELMLGSYGIESDHPWQRVERGELGLEECRVWARLESKHRFGVEIDPMEVMAPLMAEPVRESMIELVAELGQEGITLGLLTNNARELRSTWGSLAEWHELFDQVIDSSEVGVRKPSPEAFQLALDRCNQPDAGRALMVDDFSENIAGASAVGLAGVLVDEDPTPAIAQIRELVLR
jgi:epoxide hydrolase-like predicted phosphatase